MNNSSNNFIEFGNLENSLYELHDLRMDNWDALERDLLYNTSTKLPGELKQLPESQHYQNRPHVFCHHSEAATANDSSDAPVPLSVPAQSHEFRSISPAYVEKNNQSQLKAAAALPTPDPNKQHAVRRGDSQEAHSVINQKAMKKRKLSPAEKKEKKFHAQIVAKEKRRERNKILARKTRAKRKAELADLVDEVRALQKENSILRNLVTDAVQKPPVPKTAELSSPPRRCCAFDGQIPEDIMELVREMHGLPPGAPLSPDMSFCVTNALNPLNPIVYASPGFAMLTGYPMSDILGKNCNFLQGPETDQKDVRSHPVSHQLVT
jgi:hypothetical protein